MEWSAAFTYEALAEEASHGTAHHRLCKTVFHLVGLNRRGEVVVRKKFSRT